MDKTEYFICKERGHQSYNSYTDNFHTWMICNHCGTHYRFSEPELIEKNETEAYGVFQISDQT